MRQWDHGGGFSLDAGVRIEAAIERDWKARAKDGPVWRAEDAAAALLLRPPRFVSERLT